VRKPRWMSALVAVLALAALSACNRHEGNGTTTNEPAPASTAVDPAMQAREDAESTAKCAGNPLIAAMPPQTTIGGLPFRLWDCTFNSIRAVYGTDGGNEVDITLTDTRSPDIDKQPAMQDFYRHTLDTQRSIAAASVQMLLATLQTASSNPDAAQGIGGPDYLPIALPSPAGNEPMVIHVGARNDATPDEVVALFKDRYILSMEASNKDGAITGLSGPQAQALYGPFIAQMHPERLP